MKYKGGVDKSSEIKIRGVVARHEIKGGGGTNLFLDDSLKKALIGFEMILFKRDKICKINKRGYGIRIVRGGKSDENK